jgi:hypothetical protein
VVDLVYDGSQSLRDKFRFEKRTPLGYFRPVRLAYQPPASSTFFSQQTSNQPAVLFSQNKPAPAISHQPNEQAVCFS